MHWTPRAVRIGVVVALLMPAAVILLSSSLQAQIKPPPPFQPPPQPKFQPPPPFQPPPQPKLQPPFQPNIPVMVWTCLTCGKDVGTGATPPANCPHCGIKLVIGGGPPRANPPPNPPVFNPPPQNPPAVVNAPNKTDPQTSRTGLMIALIGGGLLFTCVVFAGIGVGIYYAINGGTPKKSGRLPRRRRD